MAVKIARIAADRTIRLPVTAASSATASIDTVVAAAIAIACPRRVTDATAAAAIARTTPATGLTSGVTTAAANAISKRPRRHAKIVESATASPTANGARPTTTLTTIAIANTWFANVGVAAMSRARRVKQCVAAREPSATTQKGPIHAKSGGARMLYVGVACPAYQRLFHAETPERSQSRARTK